MLITGVRLSSQYFPSFVLCIIQLHEKHDRGSRCALPLAVDILQFWNVYPTIRKIGTRANSLGLGLAV